MSDAKLRAWWWSRQGLDGKLAGRSPAEILSRTGWARSVGGVSPYLALFSRAGIGRAAADAALERVEIHELPGARGCTYVVPASDFAIALTVGRGFGEEAEMKTARRLGVTDREVERLCGAVLKSLAKRPATPEEIREAVGGAARSLGAEGKKKGLTTTLPLALGRLQAAGEIRRMPTDGRLDQQRYRYALWRPSPLARSKVPSEEAFTELARRFFGWIAPARIQDFQWFSGLGVKASKAAVAPLGLVSLAPGDDRLMFPEDLEAFRSFEVPKAPRYALVGSLDGLFHLRRDLATLVAPEDGKRAVFVEKGFEALGGLADLPSHAIVDRGRLVGLWEYDPGQGELVWTTFGAPDRALEAAVARTRSFVRKELGDARSFSLDSPKSREPRLEALRARRVSPRASGK